MALHPAIFALNVGAALVSFLVLYSSWFAAKTLKYWDLSSGSDLQLDLERRTYLVSTIMSYSFVFQLFSFFLFVFTADRLAGLFTGAMCAAGTLNVNPYGYPALLMKIFTFLLAGVWLVLNYVDNRAFDYPLLKGKYLLLLFFVPVVLCENVVQYLFFSGLKPHLITSCCGSLFSLGSETITGGLASLAPAPLKIAFFGGLAGTVVSGSLFSRHNTPTGGVVFSLFALCYFFIASLSLISFISPYIYELPTHHCPFCILQKEYRYIGYGLYGLLLAGGIGAAANGALLLFRDVDSLRGIIPLIQRRLTWITTISFTLFGAIALSYLLFSPLTLEGY